MILLVGPCRTKRTADCRRPQAQRCSAAPPFLSATHGCRDRGVKLLGSPREQQLSQAAPVSRDTWPGRAVVWQDYTSFRYLQNGHNPHAQPTANDVAGYQSCGKGSTAVCIDVVVAALQAQAMGRLSPNVAVELQEEAVLPAGKSGLHHLWRCHTCLHESGCSTHRVICIPRPCRMCRRKL